jgi:hypothetical protein
MDSMTIEILEDGSMKISTDKISMMNHMTAEAFLKNVEMAGGGKQTRKHKHGVIGAAHHALRHKLGHTHNH